MFAIPQDLTLDDRPRLTGLGCPECPGTLEVRAHGNGYLSFVCRVGHSLSTNDLLLAKELAVEKHLWDTICALEELAALVEDLAERPDPTRTVAMRQRFQQRRDGANRLAHRVRQIAEENKPLRLDTGSPGPTENERGA